MSESDEAVLGHINELVEQEHELQSRSHEGEGLSEDDARRLHRVETQLDQCWDLLRQRRARRHAGQDPDQATVRDVETVEHYRQ
jgi:Protein of unknown function (DUF2630)